MRFYLNMQDLERKRKYFNQARYWLDEGRKIATTKKYIDSIDSEFAQIADEELAEEARKKAEIEKQ
jgi:hypothetical protein